MKQIIRYFPEPDAKAVEREVEATRDLWTQGEHVRVMAAVKRNCANYDRENHECLMLDGGICALETSLHPCCNYFRDSVWGGDPAIPYDTTENAKKCAACGKPFKPGSNRAQYCAGCSKKRDAEKHRERQRRYRDKA